MEIQAAHREPDKSGVAYEPGPPGPPQELMQRALDAQRPVRALPGVGRAAESGPSEVSRRMRLRPDVLGVAAA